MQPKNCPFCQVDDSSFFYQDEFGYIMYDANPMSKGHCLIIPHRHICSFFDVSDRERKSIVTLIELARNEIQLIYQPDGLHVGFNDGKIVGQQIEHLHIHVIPRYSNQLLQLDKRWGVSNSP